MSWFLDGTGEPRIGRMVMAGILGILVLVVVIGSWYTVPAGDQAVVFNSFSGVKPATYGPGMHLKLPLFESPTRYEVRSQLYTTKAVEAASHDLQDVHTDIAVQFHPDSAWVNWLHSNVGPAYRERIIAPAVQEVVKATTAKFDASELIQNRSVVKDEIETTLATRLGASHIVLDQLSITNFAFSEQFTQAIEAKVTAQQNALAAQNKLAQVRFEAEQAIASAEGQAKAAQLISDQLVKSPAYMQYLWIQKWNGVMPSVTGGASPLIQVPQIGTQSQDVQVVGGGGCSIGCGPAAPAPTTSSTPGFGAIGLLAAMAILVVGRKVKT